MAQSQSGSGGSPAARVLGVLEPHEPAAREQHAVARVARRQHAVEQVHAERDAADQVAGAAEPHQIARRLGGQLAVADRDQLVALRRDFAEPEPAVREAAKAEVARRARARAPQRRRIAALHDPEQPLVGARVGALRALRPAQRALGRGAHARRIAGLARVRPHALVEHHRHVGAERLLHRHHALGREHAPAPVDGRGERHSLLVDAHLVGERGHLEAAAVGEPRPAPAREAVQSAELRHHVLAGPLVEVIGIREQDLRARRGELLGRYPAHRAVGGHGHERGRGDRAVRGLEHAAARVAIAVLDAEGEGRARHGISIASP